MEPLLQETSTKPFADCFLKSSLNLFGTTNYNLVQNIYPYKNSYETV